MTPILVIGLYAGKLPQAWRMATGVNVSEKLLSIMGGMEQAFATPQPSFYLPDLIIGLMLGAALRIVVYLKCKNAKKYRHNQEHGSARGEIRRTLRRILTRCLKIKSS